MTRQLARSPYLAGDGFTAADISVAYALKLAGFFGGITMDEAEQAYLARVGERPAYQRALETCLAKRRVMGLARVSGSHSPPSRLRRHAARS